MTNHVNEAELLQIIKTLKERNKAGFTNIIIELQPYDLAQVYEHIPTKYVTQLLNWLSLEQTTVLIQELDIEKQIELLKKLKPTRITQIMERMDNDDLALLFQEYSSEEVEQFLSNMNQEETEHVLDIMKYPPETAGSLMNNRYVWIRHTYTIKEAVEKLKTFAKIAETINYLYVIDTNKQLVGVVSYRDLLLSHENQRIEDIMYTRLIVVNAMDDQEKVAKLIEQYDFLALPVVENNQLMGIVTIDDMIDVVIKEANEDIEKLSASGKDIDFTTKAITAATRRIPWLILLLFIGLLSGSILNLFSHTIHEVVALTFFMPMIAGMTGNIGTQSLAVVVRGLSSHQINRKVVTNLIIREFNVSLLIGVLCSITISIIAILWQGNAVLGLVVGLSLFITLIVGTLAGTIIPLVLYKFKIDPAIASGPLITTLNDILSLLIYFGLATFFLTSLI